MYPVGKITLSMLFFRKATRSILPTDLRCNETIIAKA